MKVHLSLGLYSSYFNLVTAVDSFSFISVFVAFFPKESSGSIPGAEAFSGRRIFFFLIHSYPSNL